eukprot:GHVR01040070.1.p1 GENE.GHVR01040070.1~~GHVR01040070.1.p1  ORF type:complete len:145 (+),score=17.31 GHVR01040070.1:24-458(+)
MSDGEEMADIHEENLYVSPIAEPLVDGKLLDRSLKLIKKTDESKKCLKRGIGEVTKCLRKDQKGICFLAADVSPVDVISHLPVLCEQKNVLYAFVPSRRLLGNAAKSRRPASALFCSVPVDSNAPYGSLYAKVQTKLKAIHPYV